MKERNSEKIFEELIYGVRKVILRKRDRKREKGSR